MSDVLSHFSCLDELTQVIYQGISKFVVLSTVSDDELRIHVGLSGERGRWWRGSWTGEDFRQHFGHDTSDSLFDSYSENLAASFIQGNICISDWASEEGAAIKFTIGPTSRKPLNIPLSEMKAEEAAAYATQVFIDIALQAQSRKCRLYPSSVDFPTAEPLIVSHTPNPLKRREPVPEKRAETDVNAELSGSSSRPRDIKTGRKVEPKSEMITKSGNNAAPSAQKPASALARRAKGASLANPNKKARKYQAIEFESDDE